MKSGQVGGCLYRQLLAREGVEHLLLLSRREVTPDPPDPRAQVVVVDYDDMENAAAKLMEGRTWDAAFITLGVGASSKVTPEELWRVDHHVPLAFSKAAKQAGAKHLAIFTAAGADPESKPGIGGTAAGFGLYNQVKGTVEQDIKQLEFPTGSVVRPAALLGNEHTPKFLQWLSGGLDHIVPARFHSIHIEDVARAMILSAEEGIEGKTERWRVLEGEPLFTLLGGYKALYNDKQAKKEKKDKEKEGKPEK